MTSVDDIIRAAARLPDGIRMIYVRQEVSELRDRCQVQYNTEAYELCQANNALMNFLQRIGASRPVVGMLWMESVEAAGAAADLVEFLEFETGHQKLAALQHQALLQDMIDAHFDLLSRCNQSRTALYDARMLLANPMIGLEAAATLAGERP